MNDTDLEASPMSFSKVVATIPSLEGIHLGSQQESINRTACANIALCFPLPFSVAFHPCDQELSFVASTYFGKESLVAIWGVEMIGFAVLCIYVFFLNELLFPVFCPSCSR